MATVLTNRFRYTSALVLSFYVL